MNTTIENDNIIALTNQRKKEFTPLFRKPSYHRILLFAEELSIVTSLFISFTLYQKILENYHHHLYLFNY